MPITPLSAKRELYSDFGRDLAIHPISDDLVRKTNEEAVKESLRNIILTNKGERPFQPDFGCDIRKQFFDNFTPQTDIIIRQNIESAVARYEPRVTILDINITPSAKNIAQLVSDEQTLFSDGLRISITFEIINIIDPINLDVILKRIR